MQRTALLATVAVIAWLAGPSDAQQVYVYPAEGQSPQQQSKDEGECMGWAKTETGFDPMAPPPQVAAQVPPPQGGVVRGAARGAALGAVGGAIAGDAGEGAAIGAATGGLFGGMRRRQGYREQVAYQDQAAQQYEAVRNEFQRAYAACLSGRGYTVQ